LAAIPFSAAAFVAFVAFVALVALVAFVALIAFVAFVAFVADGTVPRLDSSTSPPVSESSFTLAPVTALAPILAFVTALFLIFGAVTAFFFSCFVPTLFLGSETAAYVVPPSARNSASSAIVFPRRKRRNPLVIPVLSFGREPPEGRDSVQATGRHLAMGSSAAILRRSEPAHAKA
jgi:hypothetical protein